MVHSAVTGKYAGIDIDEEFKKRNFVDYVTDIKIGDGVHKYRDAQDCIGELIVKYESKDEMFDVIENMDKYVRVKIV